MKITPLLFLLVLLVSCAAAEKPKYLVSLTMQVSGEEVASPSMLVEAGKPASVSVSDRFEWELVASERGEAIFLDTEFRSEERSVDYEISVTPGEKVSLQVGTGTITLVAERVEGDA